jgi:hypothetical protein
MARVPVAAELLTKASRRGSRWSAWRDRAFHCDASGSCRRRP